LLSPAERHPLGPAASGDPSTRPRPGQTTPSLCSLRPTLEPQWPPPARSASGILIRVGRWSSEPLRGGANGRSEEMQVGLSSRAGSRPPIACLPASQDEPTRSDQSSRTLCGDSWPSQGVSSWPGLASVSSISGSREGRSLLTGRSSYLALTPRPCLGRRPPPSGGTRSDQPTDGSSAFRAASPRTPSRHAHVRLPQPALVVGLLVAGRQLCALAIDVDATLGPDVVLLDVLKVDGPLVLELVDRHDR
jgi:hypothetical protein